MMVATLEILMRVIHQLLTSEEHNTQRKTAYDYVSNLSDGEKERKTKEGS